MRIEIQNTEIYILKGIYTMNTQVTNIWANALALIKDEVSELSFTTFMLPLKAVSGGSNFMNLEVPANADFIKASLEQRFYPLIKNAIHQVSKRDYNVNFVLPSEHMLEEINQPTSVAYENTHLNKRYTFDTFIVGKSNRMAHAAAVAIADNLYHNLYNPFFLYGGSGLGKTHLMHAIGNYVVENNPSANVLYVTAEEFAIEFIAATRKNEFPKFRDKFRNVDLILVDDIQFLMEKESTVEEFFHTFNALEQSNKRIIIASDRSPAELTLFDERLRSRFQSGLVCDVQKPDYETKVAILRNKAEEVGLLIPDTVYEYIAKNVGTNIRELEGAFNQILMYARLNHAELSLATAMEALKHITDNNGHKDSLSPKVILDVVSRYFDVKPEDIRSNKRNREISIPRQICMYLCRSLLDFSFPEIGKELGGKHHTTVMTACSNIEQKRKEDSVFDSSIEDILNLLN